VQRRSVLLQCAAVAQPEVQQPLRQPPPGWRFLLDDVVDVVIAFERAAGREIGADGAKGLLQQLARRLDLLEHLNSKEQFRKRNVSAPYVSSQCRGYLSLCFQASYLCGSGITCCCAASIFS
jgi:hypothetical protein